MYHGYMEEDDKCPKCRTGKLYYPKVENCSCHINPPCWECTNVKLTCDNCEWEDDSEPYKYVQTEYHGLSERVHKPKPLDKTKVDFRCKPHTHFTMIKEGVYPEHMTQEEVRKKVVGTFGGRFEYFRGGKFKYIAYTD
jgi:hypothetical protein